MRMYLDIRTKERLSLHRNIVSGMTDDTQTINAPMGHTTRRDRWQSYELNASSAIHAHTTLVEKMDDRCDGALPHGRGPAKYLSSPHSAFSMYFDVGH